jgi:Transposase IS66 family/Transposase C of IS166 homeodomain
MVETGKLGRGRAIVGLVTMPAVDPALQTALAAERVARQEAEARASSAEAMVAHLKLLIAKMKRDRFGQSSERGRRLLDQLELQLEEPITEAACWAHSRRKFFVLADAGKSPLAAEAVRRIDPIFAIEREINGLSAAQRLAARKTRIAPLVTELETWMRDQRARLSHHADNAKAMDYMLKRWPTFTRFLDDGRICLSNAPCAASPSGAKPGCSLAPTVAASAPRRSTR